tara:strand:+ start:1254 stop:1730 length:477 start_codon:yes stop_codon:yes gene_type:complete
MHNKKEYTIEIAHEKIKKYCSIQERCISDVLNKIITWKLNQKEIDELINILLSEDFINEARFSKVFCRGKFNINEWGIQKIKHELRKKNISEININNAVKIIKKNEYLEVLDKLKNRKEKSIKDNDIFTKRNKIARFLLQRGFESEIVWQKIKENKDG